jgi:uncharacterized protein YegJ (DUF2314 family)
MWWGIAIAAVVVVLAIGFFLWKRRRGRHRLISFVALTSEPVEIDPAVLAKVAGRVWKADLGDGSSEGEDGFVTGVGPMNTIIHGERMYLINSIPKTYIDEVDKQADSIPDLRIRELFRQHQAWFSCDAMGVDGSTDEKEVKDWYRRLGRLFAELLDERALLIFLPDTSLAFPINEETEAALRSKDPVTALQDTLTVPLIEVKDDDPLMIKAVKTARESWPKFVDAFESQAGENFSIKAPVSRGGNTEFIWITVTTIEGDRVYGTLANDPANLGSLKFGSKVSVQSSELNDWGYIDPKGTFIGGYTIEAVKRASRRKKS